jgi:hypothetical protein
MSNSFKIIILLFLGAIVAGVLIFLPHKALGPVLSPTTYTLQPPPKPLTTIFFGGDIMLSRNVDAAMSKADDYTLPFQKIAAVVKNADIAFANLESPFNDKGDHSVDGSLIFNADPKGIAGLNFAGFDILSTANNHVLDQGQKGVDYTIELLKNGGIIPTGTKSSTDPAENLPVIKKNNVTYGFLSYSYTALNDGGKSTSPFVNNFNDLETETRYLKSQRTLRRCRHRQHARWHRIHQRTFPSSD